MLLKPSSTTGWAHFSPPNQLTHLTLNRNFDDKYVVAVLIEPTMLVFVEPLLTPAPQPKSKEDMNFKKIGKNSLNNR